MKGGANDKAWRGGKRGVNRMGGWVGGWGGGGGARFPRSPAGLTALTSAPASSSACEPAAMMSMLSGSGSVRARMRRAVEPSAPPRLSMGVRGCWVGWGGVRGGASITRSQGVRATTATSPRTHHPLGADVVAGRPKRWERGDALRLCLPVRLPSRHGHGWVDLLDEHGQDIVEPPEE